ncbi:MAG: co-chaperone DjlA [Dokdonella sp.]|uniref:co-chaperone DjlA n=2 Tax=Dokdonella sp. TaxID=2291710 RepID=UPI002BCF2E2C|nr:co-chaperone DjlA [Dokdonella sp.]HOX70693.1 co-chaperone DjlA [Dokdonella sp.]HPG93074.1 co-chaperone DjlA [Dokdonella sp.]
MSIIGKVVGAILGLIVFRNFFGMLIGAFAGHMFDLSVVQSRRQGGGSSFIEPLFAFAGALAKSDGRVSEQEIRACERLMDRLRLDADLRRVAIEQFNVGKAPEFEVHRVVSELRAWTRGRRDLAFLLLDMLLDLVYAEGTLAANKLDMVRKLCWALGVSDAELAAVSAMKGYGPAYSGPQGGYSGQRPPRNTVPAADPYVVLGIPRESDPRDIKRAYRKLMSQHHPDKLGNVPAELKHGAEARAREINAAYERIKSERGFT